MKMDVASARLLWLENATPPPPPPGHGGSIDINVSPTHLCSRLCRWRTSPVGTADHLTTGDAGSGVLGPLPRLVIGSSLDTSSLEFDGLGGEQESGVWFSPVSKVEFPKFGGTNPQLWHYHCELYFEVHAMAIIMKTHFTTLNFIGPAAIWLQTVECRGGF